MLVCVLSQHYKCDSELLLLYPLPNFKVETSTLADIYPYHHYFFWLQYEDYNDY